MARITSTTPRLDRRRYATPVGGMDVARIHYSPRHGRIKSPRPKRVMAQQDDGQVTIGLDAHPGEQANRLPLRAIDVA